MYKFFYETIPNKDNIKRAVYLLKGRFDNISVLPIEEMGEDVYALTIGEQKNSIIISSGVSEHYSAISLLLCRFIQELALAVERDEYFCNISPKKLLQKVSVTIIPSLYSQESVEEDFIHLCEEWQIKRLYTLTEGNGNIISPRIFESPSQCRLMAELLCSSCGYSPLWAEDTENTLTNRFVKSLKRPAFEMDIIMNSGEKNLSTWVDLTYEQIKETLILMLVV